MTEDKNFNPLVRVNNVDLAGEKAIFISLTKIKGVSHSFANALCNILDIDKNKKTGYLKESEIKRLETALQNPQANKFPEWMLNRRKDYASGDDIHLLTGDIKYIQDNDIRRLQRIKSRRGLRHAWKLPVRGQRTRGNFRKGKSIGVKRKK